MELFARPQRRKVHQSLIRPPLYMGVDRGILFLEVTSVGSLFFVAGLNLVTLGLSLIWVLLLHPIAAWIYSRDPQLPALYIRSLAAKDFYAPHARLTSKVPAPKPSIPRFR